MDDQHYSVTITFRSGAQQTHGFDERARQKLLDAWRAALTHQRTDDPLLTIPLKRTTGRREDLFLDPAAIESVLIQLPSESPASS